MRVLPVLWILRVLWVLQVYVLGFTVFPGSTGIVGFTVFLVLTGITGFRGFTGFLYKKYFLPSNHVFRLHGRRLGTC